MADRRLFVVAGPDYFATRARLNRERWAREECARRAVVAALRRHTRVRGSAKRVAFEFGVARSTVSAVLRGRIAPTAAMMERLGGAR